MTTGFPSPPSLKPTFSGSYNVPPSPRAYISSAWKNRQCTLSVTQLSVTLFGGRGVAVPYCYTWPYPHHHMCKYSDIHQLEALNILVAYQTLALPQQISPAKVVIWTDNMASSWALSTGKTKDHTLAACARQIWFLAASNAHEIEIKHKRGIDILITDALSRMSRDPIKAWLVRRAVVSQGLVFLPLVTNDYTFFNSTL